MPPDTAMMSVAEPALTDLKTTPCPVPVAGVAADGVAERRGGHVFVVDFHRDGNSAAHRTFGWSGQEQSHVWSLLSCSGLRLPAPLENTPLTVEMDFGIPTGRLGLKAAVVRVLANGHLIGSAAATGWTRLRCDIPGGLSAPGEAIDLRIEHPCYVRMDFLDLGHDDRPLGLCFYAVRVYPPWMKPAMERFAPKLPEGKLVQAAAPAETSGDEAPERVIYRFGAADPGCVHLRDGWLHDPHGDAWADDRVCTLELPAPTHNSQYLARFAFCPLYIRSFMASQRINILLSGAVIGQYGTGTETSLTIPLPPELFVPGGVLPFAFSLPDGLPMHQFDPAQAPNFLSFLLDSIEIVPLPPRHAALARVRDDDVTKPASIAVSDRFVDESVEELPAAVKAAIGIEMTEILQHFESLGDNCAFGLAQRKGGCEVLGLLRFGNTPLKSLMIALDDEFRAAAVKTEVEMRLPDGKTGEYCLYVDRYGIRWHTNVYGGTADEETIFAQQTMRLAYLRRKFYEALRAGRKIATVSRAEPRKHRIPLPFADEPDVWEEKPERLRFAEVLPLFLRLNEYGTNTLLYLTRCAHNRRSGTVELVAPGVMRGYVDDFVILPEMDIKDHAAWLRIAVNAWLLDQGPNASFRNTTAA
ncbi:MAG: hypothetical protein ABSC06_30970 [Rhodopila sp.]